MESTKDEMTSFVCCKDEIKKKRKRERSKIKLMREEKRNDKSIAYTGFGCCCPRTDLWWSIL